MSSISNMDKAKHFEKCFWIFWGSVLAVLSAYVFYQPTNTELIFFRLPLIFMAGMAGMAVCVFCSFRSLKQEIADLKSGDADESTATQDSE